jgi:hypothetical protein
VSVQFADGVFREGHGLALATCVVPAPTQA